MPNMDWNEEWERKARNTALQALSRVDQWLLLAPDPRSGEGMYIGTASSSTVVDLVVDLLRKNPDVAEQVRGELE